MGHDDGHSSNYNDNDNNDDSKNYKKCNDKDDLKMLPSILQEF